MESLGRTREASRAFGDFGTDTGGFWSVIRASLASDCWAITRNKKTAVTEAHRAFRYAGLFIALKFHHSPRGNQSILQSNKSSENIDGQHGKLERVGLG